MRIGLLGGSFDPIHNGHLKLALAAKRQLKLSRVYFVLNPRSPFKSRIKLTPLRIRLKLLAAGLKGRGRFEVGTWEIHTKGPTTTVTTLERLARAHPRDAYFFIMGSDAWATFPLWDSPQRIVQLATMVVGRRPPVTRVSIPQFFRGRVRLLRGRFPNISATAIRRLVHKNPAQLKTLLPSRVWSMIQKEKLYG